MKSFASLPLGAEFKFTSDGDICIKIGFHGIPDRKEYRKENEETVYSIKNEYQDVYIKETRFNWV